MKKTLLFQLVLWLSLNALADPTFTTKNVPVNRGGQDGGTVTLRFYDDMPTVPYIAVSDFQKLMLPGSTMSVSANGSDEFILKNPNGEATVNTTTETFHSNDYMGFTNLMSQLQEGMGNVYYDGAPYVRYRKQELTPSSAEVTFDFKKYGIDLRSDENEVYFPFATIADLYSDLYYHIAGYNGEKVVVVTENQNSNIATLEKEGTKRVLDSKSRGADMAAYSYGELCFVIDHFYGMPGRSPIENDIRNNGLDKALDTADNGPDIKELLQSTDMEEYELGMSGLQLLLQDGGHTQLMYRLLAQQAWDEFGSEDDEEEDDESSSYLELIYPELVSALQDYMNDNFYYPQVALKIEAIKEVRPTDGTYYKEGDTAYLFLQTFGLTNDAAWKAYYDGGCKGDLPAIDDKFLGDLTVVLDALKRADEDPEVKNFVVDLACNLGGSLDVVIAMTALMGHQSHFYSENVLTGQRQKIYYDVDCNFDGVFDERDKDVSYNLNFAVLTTDVAFSCGNLFPSLMKDMGYPIIGEKSGGGACAVQNFITPEGLQYQLSSARARLTNDQWENIDGGVTPTYTINVPWYDIFPDYSKFYDIPAISDIIKQSFMGEDDGSVSGVQTLPTAPDATDGNWYTIDGRRLNGQPTKKGVYIHHGKTVIPQIRY